MIDYIKFWLARVIVDTSLAMLTLVIFFVCAFTYVLLSSRKKH